ncbi:MAG: RNA polymerase sigma factor [Gammaproteobacteria bacterium]|nr:MAG: RNA polymerase sigma factor [Gammaproteobacteria bacterium]
MDNSLEYFLASIEKKAYRMAEIATKNQSDALDIVQDAMIKLVEKYADRPASEWKPLFYRILHNHIMDYFRRKKIYRRLFFWKNPYQQDAEGDDVISRASDHITQEREISGRRNLQQIIKALKELPPRQQQCFMLRSWEGLSVRETALAMGCSEGSVKTHYSRAKISLKNTLVEEFY